MRRAPLVLALLVAGCGSSEKEPVVPPRARPAAPTPAVTGAPAPLASSVTVGVPVRGVPIEGGPFAGVRLLEGITAELLPVTTDRLTIPEELGELSGFEVLSERAVALVASGACVTPSGRAVVAAAAVSSVAREPSGDLLVVSEDSLGVREQGSFAVLVGLPGPGFHVVASDAGALYLHDPRATPGELFVVMGASHAKLVQCGAPIRAVATSGSRVYFAVPGAIHALAPDERPAAVFVSPGFDPRSLAVVPGCRLLLASDADRVLAIRDGVALPLVEGAGGFVRVVTCGAETSVWLLVPDRRVIVRLRGVERLG